MQMEGKTTVFNSDIATMTVTEFKAFRKALSILRQAGIAHDDAVNFLVNAQQTKRHRIANGRGHLSAFVENR